MGTRDLGPGAGVEQRRIKVRWRFVGNRGLSRSAEAAKVSGRINGIGAVFAKSVYVCSLRRICYDTAWLGLSSEGMPILNIPIYSTLASEQSTPSDEIVKRWFSRETVRENRI